MIYKFLWIYIDTDKNLEYRSLQAHALCHSSLSYDYFDISTFIGELLLKKNTKNIFKNEIEKD